MSTSLKKVGIIQARMGATRLPGKVMMDFAGKLDIAYVIERTMRAKTLDEVWLATTDKAQDDVLEQWAKASGVKYFRGSESDVLDRYYQTALLSQADVIVRVTADCPLIDPNIIDLVVNEFLAQGADYCSNVHPATYPDGQDVAAFSFKAFQKSWREAKLKSEREHVDSYMWKHPEIYNIKHVSDTPDLSEHRWTLDTKEDYDFLKLIFEELKSQNIFGTMEEVLKIVDDHPQWKKINHHNIREAGYAKSLKEDGLFNVN